MNYYEKENGINARFMNAGETYHLCSPENFDIIFVTEDDFKAGMSLMGLCAKLYPEVKIFTFELMSNHVHILTAGEEKRSLCFFDEYKKALERHFKDSNRVIHWKDFTCNPIRVDSLENFRNVTAYINRNGFVVHPDSTPFSYEWGANRFFFNPEAKSRHRSNWTSMPATSRSSVFCVSTAISSTGCSLKLTERRLDCGKNSRKSADDRSQSQPGRVLEQFNRTKLVIKTRKL